MCACSTRQAASMAARRGEDDFHPQEASKEDEGACWRMLHQLAQLGVSELLVAARNRHAPRQKENQ